VTGQATSSNLVLASGSRVRRTLLTGAGLDPKVDPADLDEPAIEADCRLRGLDTPATALELAEAKATLVAARHPGAIVVACDQMLDVGGESLRKADNMAGAAATLRRLAGREHRLICGAVIRRGDETLWRHTDEAVLTMRPLDDAAIDDYLTRAGTVVLTSVGAYQLEGLGAQLFERIEGDYFTILGLPLLPLLAALREQDLTVAGLLS